MSMVCAPFTSMRTPPEKSMLWLNLCSQKEASETKSSSPSIAKATYRYLTKSTLVVSGINRSNGMGITRGENRGEATGREPIKQARRDLAQRALSARVSAKKGPADDLQIPFRRLPGP